MTTTTTPQRSVEASDPGRPQVSARVEQLALLPTDADVPVQLRLSQRTRRVGLAGIAMARAILADQAARRRKAQAAADHISPPRAA
jgi:hypothetical protein